MDKAVTIVYRGANRGNPAFTDFYDRLVRLNQRIEQGYDATIYDYTNDLTLRSLAKKIETMLTPEVKKKFSAFVEEWDLEFKANTHELEYPLLGDLASTKDEWWLYRVPNRLVGDLKEDVVGLKWDASGRIL